MITRELLSRARAALSLMTEKDPGYRVFAELMTELESDWGGRPVLTYTSGDMVYPLTSDEGVPSELGMVDIRLALALVAHAQRELQRALREELPSGNNR